MSEKKINLLDLDRKGLRALFTDMGEKPFRADQLMKWIYHFGVTDSFVFIPGSYHSKKCIVEKICPMSEAYRMV